MKTLILVFACILVTTACAAAPATTFKNPIFGLPMHTGKVGIQLSPNEIKYYSTYIPGKDTCVLIEDNITNILYKCEAELEPGVSWTEYHQFFSVGSKAKGKNCTILHDQARTPQEIIKEKGVWNFVDKTNCGPTESANIPKSEYIEDRFQ